ncbi:precorrin-3B C(17)-methyltransferase [Anaerocolumna sp. AGMB13020]|uniref:precorrin-3B C(17)-methyltransferase n=1 Tax=Anaerocolumna sp. AGMB13020 TaxID=3081750 RepID=UPI0029552703|nr:precorrin-3B C(17)-methyltransferase [Anaerocolumna sp. AGMB13020]WOO38622.1 precorrin-3B C(17)-methyltransferase [Anaerocolumna sp. AGMB13020]
MLYIVGFGAGSLEYMTKQAVEVLEKCQVITGYTTYVELVRPYFPDKEYYSTSMKQEVSRCRLAMEEAAKGINIALICSGDAGVYGLASLCFELKKEYPSVQLKVIPGVTAALSGAALLGAPLNHDFAVISLSDLLTPWEVIEKRLQCAGLGDFCISLYNPSSKKRADHLMKACDILLQYRKGDTVCGITRNIGREGEEAEVLTLTELREREVDMFTTVFIGNSNTLRIDNSMATPRGYSV